MAWTAPATWSVSEVVTAAKMNAHVRDNLNYLKGNAGAVLIGDTLQTTALGVNVAPSASYVAYFRGLTLPVRVEASSSQLNSIELRNASADATNKWAFRIRDLAEGDFNIYDMAAAVQRLYINSAGSVGIGTTAPAGRLHVTSAGGVSGAGFAISSVAAVTTVQTVFAAGTVARGVSVWYIDRNNTGGAVVSGSALVVLLSGTNTYTNADTIQIAVTAGGAVTATRTVGTNGTHDITLMAVFL